MQLLKHWSLAADLLGAVPCASLPVLSSLGGELGFHWVPLGTKEENSSNKFLFHIALYGAS